MALSEAILEIADDIRKATDELIDSNALKTVFFGFVKQLKTAVKAAEGQQHPVNTGFPFIMGPNPRSQEESTMKAVEKELAKALAHEEVQNQSMVEVVGGQMGCSEAVTMTQVDPRMPVGAKTLMGTEVYVLGEGRKLYYSQEETDKFRKGRPQQ